MRSYPLPGGQTHRYGYNEWYGDAGTGLSGVGNSYDYGARMYSPRLGRWLSTDPRTSEYPSWNPYHCSMNSPLRYKDADGEVVQDAQGNIIVTEIGEGEYEQGDRHEIEGTPFLRQIYYKVTDVKVMTDKGNEIKAARAIDDYSVRERIYLRDGGLVADREFSGDPVGSSDPVNCGYNCVGNSLTDKRLNFDISQFESTSWLSDDGWRSLYFMESIQPDITIGIYKVGLSSVHVEVFETPTKVSTKGGILPDPLPPALSTPGVTPVVPGASYSLMRRDQQDTRVYPTDFVGPLQPNDIRMDIPSTSTVSNGIRTVDPATFDTIQSSIRATTP